MKKKDIVLFIVSLTLITLQTIVACIDFVLWLKIILSIILFIALVLIIVLQVKAYIKQIKDANKNIGNVEGTPNTLSMLDMYAILQIPPQYNADGTLKDIYELLQLEPQYDDEGNRILTIYERLQLNPKFDKNGNEIPRVVVIKNRVNAIVKLKAAPMPLTYLPREQLITGYNPIKTEPVIGVDALEKPSIKQVPVVKIPPKPVAKAKPKSAPKPNLPGKKGKITISKPKVSYKTTQEFGAGANIFAIDKPGSKKPSSNDTPKVTKVDAPTGGSKNATVGNSKKNVNDTKTNDKGNVIKQPTKDVPKVSEAEIEMI